MNRVLTVIAAAAAIGLLALPGGATARHHHPGKSVKRGARHDGRPGKFPTIASLTAGTVTSFDGSTLVVTLTNGSAVSAAVDARTHLMCAVIPPGFPGGPTGPTGPSGSTPRHEGYPPGAGDKPEPPEGYRPGAGDKPEPPEGYRPPKPPPGPRPYWLKPCPTSALTPGTLVHALSVEASPTGVRFTGLGLILTAPPPSSAESSTGAS
jgi:hypothetical protein